jgi:Pentapeptide repeats (8 copies)
MTVVLSDRAARVPAVRVLAALVLCLLVLALAAVAVFVLPAYLAPRSAFTNAGDAVRAQNDARGVMVQVAGGLVLLVGAYVTWRQLQLSRQSMQQTMEATNAQLKAAQDQLTIAQESQLTQRFAQAVDQLGSEQIVVRIGGIYALERVARNSAADAGAVAELLCSYIRQHSPRTDSDAGPAPESSASGLAAWSLASGPAGAPVHLELRAADVRTALLVLSKGNVRPEGDEPLRLLGADLRRAGLDRARLAGVDLEGADLSWAWLRWARLDGADLSQADLRDAHLDGASLVGAEMTGAQLRGAHLEGASLLGVTDLDQARLVGAVADDQTVWPEGFSPRAAGVAFISAES